MKSIFFYLVGFAISCLLVLLNASCTSPSQNHPITPIEQDNPTIIYTADWMLQGQMKIDPFGMASLPRIYPPLSFQMSKELKDSLVLLLQGFENYPDSGLYNCGDCITYTITLQSGDRSKTCIINDAAFNRPEFQRLYPVIAKLLSIRDRIYYGQSTWLGLTYTFGFDKSVYRPGDSIRYYCRIANHTDGIRTLYFRNSYRLWLYISGEAPTFISTYMPDYAKATSDTSSPARIELPAGQEIEVSQTWGQSFDYSGVHYSTLPVGQYQAKMLVFTGMTYRDSYPETFNIPFTIGN